MKIIYRQGDLLEAPESYILHGCNAQGVMGSGVAKLIRAKYPSAYTLYKAVEAKQGLCLGDVMYAQQDDGKTIINAITQEFYGRSTTTVYVDYHAIAEVVDTMEWLTKGFSQQGQHVTRIAMPKIGAGLANGDWAIISNIIEQGSSFFQPVVYTL